MERGWVGVVGGRWGRGARKTRAAPSEGVLIRGEFASDGVGCWVPVGSHQSMGDILDKGSRH